MDARDRTGAATVLVGIDGSKGSLAALRWANMLAGEIGLGLRAAMAWSDPDEAAREASDPVAAMHQRTVARIADITRSVACEDVEPLSLHGQPAQTFLEAETQADVAMVVVGSRGLGTIPGLLLGSFSRRVLWHTARPLVLIPHTWPALTGRIEHVLVGTDRSQCAQDAVDWAAGLCAALGASATVLRCLDPGAELRVGRLDEINERARVEAYEQCERFRSHGVAYEPIVSNSDPRTEIPTVATATGAGLIVIGKRGDSQLEAVGGTASYLIRHSPLPLAVIPSPQQPAH
ncbi:MAG: universal stress protein [Acidimicrobiia bacterium]